MCRNAGLIGSLSNTVLMLRFMIRGYISIRWHDQSAHVTSNSQQLANRMRGTFRVASLAGCAHTSALVTTTSSSSRVATTRKLLKGSVLNNILYLCMSFDGNDISSLSPLQLTSLYISCWFILCFWYPIPWSVSYNHIVFFKCRNFAFFLSANESHHFS